MTTAYITHPDCLLHENPDQHPESAARLHAIRDALWSAGLWEQLQHIEAPLATIPQLARVHQTDYIELVEAASPDVGYQPEALGRSVVAHLRQLMRLHVPEESGSRHFQNGDPQ